MRYAPTKVFILEDGKYIEISYDDYQRLSEENPKRRFCYLEECLWRFPKKTM